MEKMVEIPEKDFERMNIIQSAIDLDLLEQVVSSLNDIKNGRAVRVK